MPVSELAIIYLSVGAPFGVHYLVLQGRLDLLTFLKTMTAVLFWPVPAVRMIAAQFYSNATELFGLAGEIDSELIDKAAICYARAISQSAHLPETERKKIVDAIVEFFEISISLGSRDPGQIRKYRNLLSAAGHQTPSLGSICLRRKNDRIAESKRRNASNEIRKAIDQFEPEHPEFSTSALDLLNVFDQPETANPTISISTYQPLAERQFPL